MSWFILIQFSSRQHFRTIFILSRTRICFLATCLLHESSCTRRIKEEEEQLEHSVHHRMGVKKEIEKKKDIDIGCGLFASYLPGCTACSDITGFPLHFHVYRLWVTLPPPPSPANQFNDFIRPLPFRAWNSRWIRGKSKSRILKGKRQVRTIVKM